MAIEQVVPKKIRGIKALIAEGLELDFHIKEQKTRLEEIKEMCRQHAAYRRTDQLFGDYNCGVRAETQSAANIDVRVLAGEVDTEDFYDLVKPDLKACREHFGEERFMEIADIVEYPYSKITFGEVVNDEEKED